MAIDFSQFLSRYGELRVYDRAGSTHLGTLKGTGVSFTDPFGDESGEAAFTVNRAEPALAASPGMLNDAMVRVAFPLGTDENALSEPFAFLAFPSSGVVIGAGDDAAKTISVTGKGLLHVFGDHKIRHEKYRAHIDEMRYFGWMSGWYPASSSRGWITPQGVKWSNDPTARAGYPDEFENFDPDAMWIAATGPTVTQPEGSIHLLRNKPGTFVLTKRTAVRFHYTADNYMTMWLNGELIETLRADPYVWRRMNTWDALLEPGEYFIAAKIENFSPTTGGNPMGFLFSAWTLDGYGQPDKYLLRSNTTNWYAYQASSGEPGLSVGEIVLRVLQEGSGLGVTSYGRILPSFAALTDTAGANWPLIENRSWRVGTSGLQIIADLGETSADFDMSAYWNLYAHVAYGTNRSGSVQMQRGVHIVDYTYSMTPPTATKAWLQTPEGYTTVNSSAAIEAREEFIEEGTAANVAQAIRNATVALESLSRIRYSYTAVFYAIPGFQPYITFWNGDTIMGFDHAGNQVPLRVVSMNYNRSDSGGAARWTVELEEV